MASSARWTTSGLPMEPAGANAVEEARPADCAMCAIPTSSGSLEGVKTIATGKLNQVAARLGDQAPMAATCCNACRTCVQTNAIALGLAAVVGAGAWVARLFGRREQH